MHYYRASGKGDREGFIKDPTARTKTIPIHPVYPIHLACQVNEQVNRLIPKRDIYTSIWFVHVVVVYH